MRAGRLDRRITIQTKVVTQDDFGGEVVSWATLAEVYAEKIENRGAERFAAQQVVGAAIMTFRFRWSEVVKAVTVTHRITFDGREFDITAVREIGRREGIEVDCAARSEDPVAV